ncbi:hypothetical protein SDC9_171643 [bioreactor metagenome]|uniref:Uncharacterized protein n=1 Tax=bioreactor metagenome TaxID=1076179 RepID=A0A645GBE9_9ZZZZ
MDLHRAVGAVAGNRVAEVVFIGGARDVFGVGRTVIPAPEFDVAFFKGTGFQSFDVARDFEVVDVNLKDPGAGGRNRNISCILRERVHSGEYPALLSVLAGELQEIADPLEVAGDPVGVVDGVARRFPFERIQFGDQFIPFRLRNQFQKLRHFGLEGTCPQKCRRRHPVKQSHRPSCFWLCARNTDRNEYIRQTGFCQADATG